MNVVYLLLRQRSATFGHGDYGSEWVIGDTYTPFQPAFSSREAAEAHLGTLPDYERTGLFLTPVELR